MFKGMFMPGLEDVHVDSYLEWISRFRMSSMVNVVKEQVAEWAER